MECRRRRHFCFPHRPQITHRKHSFFPSQHSPFHIDILGELPLCTFSNFFKHDVILLPLRRTSIRPRHAFLRPVSHTRTLEGRRHRAVSVRHCCRQEGPRQALTQIRESSDGQRWFMVYGTCSMSRKRAPKPLFSISPPDLHSVLIP